jgi:hypothetical protein
VREQGFVGDPDLSAGAGMAAIVGDQDADSDEFADEFVLGAAWRPLVDGGRSGGLSLAVGCWDRECVKHAGQGGSCLAIQRCERRFDDPADGTLDAAQRFIGRKGQQARLFGFGVAARLVSL